MAPNLTPALLAELVRLPALLSVPGDALVGSAAGRTPRGGLLVTSSALLYAGGMALNDYADRLVDGLERPGRPVPSGRVPAAQARSIAVRLMAAGVATAGVLGGRRALRVAVPLAGTVWAYDTRAKSGPAGPWVMAACRGLDVLLGAAPGAVCRAMPSAGIVAAHTANVTTLSRHEVDGAPAAVVEAVRRRAWMIAAAPPVLALLRGRPREALVAAVVSGAYAAQCTGGLSAAAREPSPALTQRAVGAGVLGIMPLQAALLVASGAPRRSAAILAVLPLARRASHRRRVT